MTARRPRRGFTLLELLIVILILSILMGITVVGVSHFIGKGKEAKTRVLIDQLTRAVEAYHDSEAGGGDYPPTSLRERGAGTNGVNEGVESLLAHLMSRRGGPFVEDLKESDYGNTDNDTITGWDPQWIFGDSRAREIVDAWGNPLVYFHWRDYEHPSSYMTRYKLRNKRYVNARPARDRNKTWPRYRKFMIWSMGPDGGNKDGHGDGPCNWRQ